MPETRQKISQEMADFLQNWMTTFFSSMHYW